MYSITLKCFLHHNPNALVLHQEYQPVLAKSERPPGNVEAVTSQPIHPHMVPPTPPVTIPTPVSRDQNIDSAMGTTTAPIITPVIRYNQPKVTYHNVQNRAIRVFYYVSRIM